MAFVSLLCPVDYSSNAREALDLAARIASEDGARLTLLHVTESPVAGEVEGAAATAQLSAQLIRSDELALARWRSGVAARYPTMTVVARRLDGVPWDVITSTARSGAHDLVVMGTHGRSGLTRAAVGSVAERVVRNAPCPVLVVPAPG